MEAGEASEAAIWDYCFVIFPDSILPRGNETGGKLTKWVIGSKFQARPGSFSSDLKVQETASARELPRR
jgi:hypothetical protein